MAQDYQEGPPTEKLRIPIESVANKTLNILMERHDIDPSNAPNLKQALFVTSREQMRRKLLEMGHSPEGAFTSIASAMTLPSGHTPDHLNQIVWFDAQNPIINQMRFLKPDKFEKNLLTEHSIIIEEISHFLYKDQYFKRYQSPPPDWLVEMIGAIDKYILIQHLFSNQYGRRMNGQEHFNAKKIVFSAVDANVSSDAHRLGQGNAIRVLQELMSLEDKGKKKDADNLFHSAYSLKQDKVLQLLQALQSPKNTP